MADSPAQAELHAAIRSESRRWLDATLEATGPLSLFDTHTHIGRNDPDGFRQTPEELVAALDRVSGDARAVTFPMCEPDGYGPANDAAREAAESSGGRLAWFCRVDPHADPVPEAVRCLDRGARGVKLHPRAEGFGMDDPEVERLVALAGERRVPVLIHAGRGIPALGRDTVTLAGRYPGASLILAHAAVSDLAWLTRVMPAHPNLFIDTSWWNPADLIALYGLVPPGQILWASDSPYGDPASAAGLGLRYPLAAGLAPEAIRSIAGGQIGRLLDGREPIDAGPPAGPPGPLDPGLERVCSHLYTALGRILAEGDAEESVALARLACDPDGATGAACREIIRLLDLYERYDTEMPEGLVFTGAMQFLIAAMTVARTPDVPLPRP